MTSNGLETILARKHVEVAKAKSITPLAVLQDRLEKVGRPRNFFQAVVDKREYRPRIIAEVKKSSPSAGVIRSDFDPVGIAREYELAGAAAISCLTDEQHFDGHLGYIQQIRGAVDLPVLRKDFIVDQYQVWESRAAGADAILLIAEVLTEADMLDMMILARELGMTVLIEVHDVENLLRVQRHIGFPHPGYSLLGINNRDLRSMTTDVSHTIRMLDVLEEDGVDRNVIVSESGIRTREDLGKLAQHGIHVALIGEHLLKQDSPGNALRELLGRGQPAQTE